MGVSLGHSGPTSCVRNYGTKCFSSSGLAMGTSVMALVSPFRGTRSARDPRRRVPGPSRWEHSSCVMVTGMEMLLGSSLAGPGHELESIVAMGSCLVCVVPVTECYQLGNL